MSSLQKLKIFIVQYWKMGYIIVVIVILKFFKESVQKMIDIKKIKFLEVGFVDDPKAVEDDTVGKYYPKETYINQLHGQSTSSMSFVTDAQYQLAKDMVKNHHAKSQSEKTTI